MNWKQKTEHLQMLISDIRERKFPYIERDKKRIDWSLYDTAQCREVSDVITFIGVFVDYVWNNYITKSPRPRNIGRPSIPSDDLTKILLTQTYFGNSNRPAEGWLYIFQEKLRLKTEFSYKTIERGYDKEIKKEVHEILDGVFNVTNLCVRGLEKIFSVDGSGTPTSVKQNYASDRELQRKKKSKKESDKFPLAALNPKHDYVYKEAIIGVKYKLFAGWKSTTDHTKGETTLFPKVFAQAIMNHPNMEMILGDGIFAVRWICALVGNYNVIPRFLPRRNVRFKRKGVREWSEMLLSLFSNPQDWLAEYHLRSNSETGFSCLANAYPQPLRKKLLQRRETEDYLRAIVHNIKRLCYLKYLDDDINQRLRAIFN